MSKTWSLGKYARKPRKLVLWYFSLCSGALNISHRIKSSNSNFGFERDSSQSMFSTLEPTKLVQTEATNICWFRKAGLIKDQLNVYVRTYKKRDSWNEPLHVWHKLSTFNDTRNASWWCVKGTFWRILSIFVCYLQIDVVDSIEPLTCRWRTWLTSREMSKVFDNVHVFLLSLTENRIVIVCWDAGRMQG